MVCMRCYGRKQIARRRASTFILSHPDAAPLAEETLHRPRTLHGRRDLWAALGRGGGGVWRVPAGAVLVVQRRGAGAAVALPSPDFPRSTARLPRRRGKSGD